MANFIHLAKELIKRIPEEFQNPITTATARKNPEKIIQTRSIALYAQVKSGGGNTVNMRSPALTRTLEQLANQGSGHATDYNGVTFKFLLNDVNNSGTTTPVSSL